MRLDVDKETLTIMGVQFDNKKDFRGVWHTISTSMFEGYEPTLEDVLQLKELAAIYRMEASAS